MKTFFESSYFTLFHDEQNDVIVIYRSATAYAGLEVIPGAIDAVIEALKPFVDRPVLFDLRDARGNNNPSWEAVMRPQVKRLDEMFPLFAVIVKTAAGRMHTQRLARERGSPSDNIFSDLTDALMYLATNRR